MGARGRCHPLEVGAELSDMGDVRRMGRRRMMMMVMMMVKRRKTMMMVVMMF